MRSVAEEQRFGKVMRSVSDLSEAETETLDNSDFAECDSPAEECGGWKKPLLLWDWDDTLFCTTHLGRQGVSVTVQETELASDLQRDLEHYGAVVGQTLELAMSLGRVVIVTNAENGWVELTCSRFMPTVYEKYVKYIPIISARSCFESPTVRSPVEWKRLAFQRLISDTHVVSFGDSCHERDALLLTAKQLQLPLMKSVKLIERPDLGALLKQHHLVQKCLIQIITHPVSLDLCIQSQSQSVQSCRPRN